MFVRESTRLKQRQWQRTVTGGTVREPNETADHGATRVRDHPVLGSPPAPRTVEFTFDGAPIAALEGEPIAAALLASGIRVFRTMPERGEARGGFCFVGRCPDCQVNVDGVPGVRACVTRVVPGMAVQTQHGLGRVDWDIVEEDGQ